MATASSSILSKATPYNNLQISSTIPFRGVKKEFHVGSGVNPGLIHRKSLMVHLHPRHRDAITGADEKPVILQPKVGTAGGDAMSFWKDKVTWWLSLAILDPIKSINPPRRMISCDDHPWSSLFEGWKLKEKWNHKPVTLWRRSQAELTLVCHRKNHPPTALWIIVAGKMGAAGPPLTCLFPLQCQIGIWSQRAPCNSKPCQPQPLQSRTALLPKLLILLYLLLPAGTIFLQHAIGYFQLTWQFHRIICGKLLAQFLQLRLQATDQRVLVNSRGRCGKDLHTLQARRKVQSGAALFGIGFGRAQGTNHWGFGISTQGLCQQQCEFGIPKSRHGVVLCFAAPAVRGIRILRNRAGAGEFLAVEAAEPEGPTPPFLTIHTMDQPLTSSSTGCIPQSIDALGQPHETSWLVVQVHWCNFSDVLGMESGFGK